MTASKPKKLTDALRDLIGLCDFYGIGTDDDKLAHNAEGKLDEAWALLHRLTNKENQP